MRSFGKKSQCLAFPEAKKANWHSQLHAQRSKMHSIPLGPSEKNSFCAKAQRRRDMCDPSGKKPILGHTKRLKKVLLTTQGCARLRTGPIIMQIPRGYQKKSLLCRKARYVRSLGKKPTFWPSQRLKKLTGTLSCMLKGPKCIQSLWDHPKKFLLCISTKKARYVRSLRKTTLWGIRRG